MRGGRELPSGISQSAASVPAPLLCQMFSHPVGALLYEMSSEISPYEANPDAETSTAKQQNRVCFYSDLLRFLALKKPEFFPNCYNLDAVQSEIKGLQK